MHVALRLAKRVDEGDNDYDDEGGLEESQKTEDTIGIHRNETRSTGSAAWRVSLETWDRQIEYIEMRPEAPGVQAH